jgi:hypothetical protein
MNSPTTSNSRIWPSALGYGLLTLAWFAVVDGGDLDGQTARTWVAIAILGASHLVFGFVVARWWVLLFPVSAIALAVPFGFPETRYEETFPLFFEQAFYSIPEALLLGVGVAAANILRRVSLRSS